MTLQNFEALLEKAKEAPELAAKLRGSAAKITAIADLIESGNIGKVRQLPTKGIVSRFDALMIKVAKFQFKVKRHTQEMTPGFQRQLLESFKKL